MLADGTRVPALGLGTWRMGERPDTHRDEVAALRHGFDLGLSLVDTAEMYADGGSERVVGEAIAGRRDEVFVVSKVYPHRAGRRAAIGACEASLARLAIERIDLYLLHWRGGVPLGESLEALAALRKAGKIRHYGVSNLDLADMSEAWSLGAGRAIATNQLLYNPTRRGIEWDLLPWCAERNIPVMAYSPIEQGRLSDEPGLGDLAAEIGLSAAQLALAWVLSRKNVVAIPKAGSRSHVDENFAALTHSLDHAVLARLDRLFPPPHRATPLAML